MNRLPIPRLFPCSGRYPTTDRPTRREMLAKSAGGLGGIALAWLMGQERARAAAVDLTPKIAQIAPRAKAVILLYMGGGPSQMDLLDPKPALAKYAGKPIPMSITTRDLKATANVYPTKFKFDRHGQCGTEVSELLPHLASCIDDVTVIRSGRTTRIDHGEALLMMHCGRPLSGYPTLGSWVTYGLGTANSNLPAYICMPDGSSERTRNAMTSGFLPALYQASPLNVSGAEPFFYLHPPKDAPASQREYLNLTQMLNRRHQAERKETSELDARIQNFELAARMQVEAMQQVDVASEPESIKRLYGLDQEQTESFGRRCLIARRLVEAGVRFVHVMRSDWDHHSRLYESLPRACRQSDQPVAALLKDLKQRGLLDETLVIWTGEFGRLPTVEAGDGRDHNPFGFSFWMAGGGIKGGHVHGATDDFGYAAAQDVVNVADLHATILHLVGLNYEALTYPFEGRDETLVGVEKARVVREIMA
jgi:hypothetical protein